MGLIGVGSAARGIGSAVAGVAEVFRANSTAEAAHQHAEHVAALTQYQSEFGQSNRTRFDAVVDAINRIPRPAMAFATMGLFGFAMWQPVAFAARMQGLALIPEQLWWLMGAVVGFYFGARELHHRRAAPPSAAAVAQVAASVRAMSQPQAADPPDATGIIEPNAVIAEWRQSR